MTYVPYFQPYRKNTSYPLFCKLALIRYKPWSQCLEDSWGGQLGDPEPAPQEFVEKWEDFYSNSMNKTEKEIFDRSNPEYEQSIQRDIHRQGSPQLHETTRTRQVRREICSPADTAGERPVD